MNFKIDLHNHSALSSDGGITAKQYKQALKSGKIDYVAITDHNEIDFAVNLHKELGDKIIVGEEIKTKSGDLVGLFLKTIIPANVSLSEAVKLIKSQNGLIYVPHPFDTRRSGIPMSDLDQVIDQIDIIEIFNARNIGNKSNDQALEYAKKHNKVKAVGTDAHSYGEFGHTYNIIKGVPNRSSILDLLDKAEHVKKHVNIWGFLAPFRNKIKKILNKK